MVTFPLGGNSLIGVSPFALHEQFRHLVLLGNAFSQYSELRQSRFAPFGILKESASGDTVSGEAPLPLCASTQAGYCVPRSKFRGEQLVLYFQPFMTERPLDHTGYVALPSAFNDLAVMTFSGRCRYAQKPTTQPFDCAGPFQVGTRTSHFRCPIPLPHTPAVFWQFVKKYLSQDLMTFKQPLVQERVLFKIYSTKRKAKTRKQPPCYIMK
eukprot:GHVT01053788.1.p1 GENE.GHVT01053788.1~~GHVT01053788.1.p1  ORF type:complete len:211 (+),score=5.33 GHVT01053788.1:652-1284(+)